MNPVTLRLPTIAGNSSSITLALCEVPDTGRRTLTDMIEQSGRPEAPFSVSGGQSYRGERTWSAAGSSLARRQALGAVRRP